MILQARIRARRRIWRCRWNICYSEVVEGVAKSEGVEESRAKVDHTLAIGATGWLPIVISSMRRVSYNHGYANSEQTVPLVVRVSPGGVGIVPQASNQPEVKSPVTLSDHGQCWHGV